ncbi:hypothetical protein [Paenibacillus sp. MBLB4367]|uniref:hypothetical protein n=1 Tax=Paenibacillus sp. MBLB4367 TaxID=3384767 RepID=UPI003907F07F
MARLEYRVLDEGEQFPLLYEYDRIGLGEIALRFSCDYFVKEQQVYEKTSCSMEKRELYVIYVKKAEEEHAYEAVQVQRPDWRGVRVEIRKFTDEAIHYPVLDIRDFEDEREALLQLNSHYVYADGKEWEKSSTEIDEDRKRYAVYVREVGANG